MINAVSRTIERLLDSFPRPSAQEPSPVRIGLVTYDKDVHFYNLSPRLTQPQMMVISDIDDVFVPLHDGFLVNIEESRYEKKKKNFLSSFTTLGVCIIRIILSLGLSLKRFCSNCQ